MFAGILQSDQLDRPAERLTRFGQRADTVAQQFVDVWLVVAVQSGGLVVNPLFRARDGRSPREATNTG